MLSFLKIPRTAQDRLSKLDAIYCKYLLPYATLSDDERKKLLQKVDSQNRRTTDDDEEGECVVKGTSIPLSTFYRIARNTLSVWFPHSNISANTDVYAEDPAQVKKKEHHFAFSYFISSVTCSFFFIRLKRLTGN